MKKLFAILAAAAALAMFTGCDPDNKDDERISSLIPKSYGEVSLMNGDVHFKYVYTPAWTGDYSYDGDYIKKSEEGGRAVNYVWKDGDLVSAYTDNLTHHVSYTSEANPFKDGMDPTLRFIFDDPFIYGLMGKRAAHLPSKLLTISGSGDFENKELRLYSYKKDVQGRISEIKIVRGDPETEEPFQEQMHTQLIRFNY